MSACTSCGRAHRVSILESGRLLIGVLRSGVSHTMGLFARVVVCALYCSGRIGEVARSESEGMQAMPLSTVRGMVQY